MENKNEVRKKILALRDALTPEVRMRDSEKIMAQMIELPCYQEAEVILAYVSYRSEVDTFGLIRHALGEGKQVFAPRVDGKEMEFWQIRSINDLKTGYKGILEPEETHSYPSYQAEAKPENILMWMPGAVFDKARHRIGYGGGFYDRYLDRLAREHNVARTLTTVALAFDCQVLEEIPYEIHDYRPNFVLTPTFLQSSR